MKHFHNTAFLFPFLLPRFGSPKFLHAKFVFSSFQRRFQPPEAKEALHPSNTEEPPSASGVRFGEAKVRKLSPPQKMIVFKVGFCVPPKKMKVFYEKKLCRKSSKLPVKAQKPRSTTKGFIDVRGLIVHVSSFIVH